MYTRPDYANVSDFENVLPIVFRALSENVLENVLPTVFRMGAPYERGAGVPRS